MHPARLTTAGLLFLILVLSPFATVPAQNDPLADPSQAVLKLRITLDAGKEVENVAVSPDGKTIAAFANHTVQVWDVPTGKLERTFTGFKKWPALRWSPDSSKLFLTNWGKTPAIWVAQPPALELRALDLKPKLQTVVWSSDSRSLLTTHSGNLLSVWDMQTLTSRFEQKLKKELLTATWSPDGRSVMTTSTDGGWFAEYKLNPHSLVQAWESETGREKFTIRLNGLRGQAEFSPDGQFILTRSSEVPQLWNAKTGNLHAELNPPWCKYKNCGTNFATLTCDGRLAVTGSGSWFQKEIWDVASGTVLAQIEGEQGDTFVIRGLSPDGRLLAIYRQHFKSWKSFAEESSIELYDTSTGKRKVALTGKNMMWSTHQVVWSADSQTLVTAGGSHGYQGKIWDISSGKLRADLSLIAKESSFPFTTVCYDDLDDLSFHQSQRLLIGTSSKLVKLWDPLSGKLLQTIAGSYAQWSKDGRLLTTRNVDKKSIAIWELVNNG